MDPARRAVPTAGNPVYAWLLFAVGAAGVAGLLAVFVALARLPGSAFLPSAQDFYTLLVGHVAFSLIVWLLSGVVVTAAYTAAPAAGEPVPARMAGLWLAGAGSMILLVYAVAGGGRPVLSDYVPVLEAPGFLLGYALFASGVAASLGSLLWGADRRRGRPLSLPLFGMRCVGAAFAVAILALLAGITTTPGRDYQAIFWGAGHALQYVYAGTLAVVWYLLAPGVAGRPVAPGLARAAFALYPVLALPAAAAYGLLDPASVPTSRALSLILGAGVSVPTMVHLVLIGIAVARQVRQAGATWFAAARRRPETVALAFSVGFYLLGGLLAPIGERGTLRVTAHYHAILVGGVTIAFMGLAYHLLSAMGWNGIRARVGTAQLYLFGTGVLATVVILGWAGALGAPRKMYGGALQGAAWSGAMSLMGVAAVLAATGGSLFVGAVLSALLHVRPTSRPGHLAEAVPAEAPLP